MSRNKITLTHHQQKFIAWQLIRQRSSCDEDKFTSILAEAQVDLNPHQVDAALFAFHSPLSMGAILADEVGLGKTIEGKDNGLYERQGKSVNNFPATMPYPTGDLAAEARITYLLSIVSKDTTSQSPLQHTREFRFCRIILMMLCQVLKIWKQRYQSRITYIRKDMCSDGLLRLIG